MNNTTLGLLLIKISSIHDIIKNFKEHFKILEKNDIINENEYYELNDFLKNYFEEVNNYNSMLLFLIENNTFAENNDNSIKRLENINKEIEEIYKKINNYFINYGYNSINEILKFFCYDETFDINFIKKINFIDKYFTPVKLNIIENLNINNEAPSLKIKDIEKKN